MLSMTEARQHSFFWTWRTGPALDGKRHNPQWDMSLAMELGYWCVVAESIWTDSARPTNMRNLTGFCSTIGGATVTPPFTAAFPASATGGAGAPTVAAAALAEYPWPPALSAADTTYMYTQTQTPTLMPNFTPTPNSAAGVASAAYSVGNGIANPAVTSPWFTLQAGQACPSLSPRARADCPQTGTPGASPSPTARRSSADGPRALRRPLRPPAAPRRSADARTIALCRHCLSAVST